MFENGIAARITHRRLLYLVWILLILLAAQLTLTACSPGGSNPAPTNQAGGEDSSAKGKTAQKKSDAVGSEDDLDEADETSAAKHKKAAAAKPALSMKGKQTGVTEDSYVVQQQNEFLGASTLKLGKSGVRLESSTLTIIIPAGGKAVAYNAQNGNCMTLSSKSRSLLGGNSNFPAESKQESKKVGSEKIAGLNCTHYTVSRVVPHPKTKKMLTIWTSDVWATKDIKLSPTVIKDCARITMMPENLGFPVRMTRLASSTTSEQIKGMSKSQVRQVVTTTSFARAKLDKGEFALLPGFKTVTDEMQLMMSTEDTDLAGAPDLEESGKESLR